MPPLQEDWPISISPYRHYACAKGGVTIESSVPPKDGTVAIVISVRDGLKFFKLCFHSLLSFTDRPFSIHVIDHLGGLPTKKYFRTMHANHPVYLHRYDGDFNFALQANLGLREAFKFPQVKYGLLLNADTVVEPFWLSKMLDAMSIHDRIGIVGPMSNKANPEQMDRGNFGMAVPAQRASGFCMLFKRQVWEELGGFDEEFVGGGFEDWDFCERAIRNGWLVTIDGKTHIHHFYKQFRRREFDTEMKANEERFFKKHPLVYDMIKQGQLVKS